MLHVMSLVPMRVLCVHANLHDTEHEDMIEPTNNRRPITRTKIPGWDKDQRAFRASLRLQTTAGRFGSTRTICSAELPQPTR